MWEKTIQNNKNLERIIFMAADSKLQDAQNFISLIGKFGLAKI